jgi:hypothetical protein
VRELAAHVERADHNYRRSDDESVEAQEMVGLRHNTGASPRQYYTAEFKPGVIAAS